MSAHKLAQYGITEEVLENLDDAAHELFTGEFEIHEITDFLKTIAEFVSIYVRNEDKEAKEACLMAAWQYIDGKHGIVDLLDDKIKLNALLEAFDGKVIRFAVERMILPSVARKL